MSQSGQAAPGSQTAQKRGSPQEFQKGLCPVDTLIPAQ